MHVDCNESLCVSNRYCVIEVLSINLIYLQKRIKYNVKKSTRRYYN